MQAFITPPRMITCLGQNAKESMDRILKGDNHGFGPVTYAGKTYLAGTISDGGDDRLTALREHIIASLIPDAKRMKARFNSARIATLVGTCDYQSDKASIAHKAYADDSVWHGYSLSDQHPAYAALAIANALSLKGPAIATTTACASSASAIARGLDLLESGEMDAVLVGGLDSASGLILAGFDSLGALSDKACNPFSKNRKGITISDGAAFFFLTREKLIEDFPIAITGVGESGDGYHMTSPDPKGTGAIESMQRALAQAHLGCDEIGYINLHGTGTEANDSMEAKAVAAVFPLSTSASSTKALTGHTLGAAGALEASICAYTLMSGKECILPPHIYDGVRDETMPQLHFTTKGERRIMHACLSSSFAFGGCNTSIIIERKDTI